MSKFIFNLSPWAFLQDRLGLSSVCHRKTMCVKGSGKTLTLELEANSGRKWILTALSVNFIPLGAALNHNNIILILCFQYLIKENVKMPNYMQMMSFQIGFLNVIRDSVRPMSTHAYKCAQPTYTFLTGSYTSG